jgi:hypothetical protein
MSDQNSSISSRGAIIVVSALAIFGAFSFAMAGLTISKSSASMARFSQHVVVPSRG